jgi:predicted  nucleic acid-binding Zn-ribbon protein
MKYRSMVALLASGTLAAVVFADSTTKPANAPSTQPTAYFPTAGEAGYGSAGFSRQYYPGPPFMMQQAVVNPADIAQQASCVVQIDSDFSGNPYGYQGGASDNQTAAGLLSSTLLVDSAVARIPDAKLQDHRSQIQVQAFPTGVQFVRLNVILTKGDSDLQPDAAAQLLKAVCESLKSAFDESIQASNAAAQARVDSAQKQIDSAKSQLKDIHQQVQQANDALNSNGGRYYGDIDNTINNLKQQKSSMDSELARYTAQLSQLDPSVGLLSGDWDDLVKLRTQRLDDAVQAQKSGKATTQEVLEAQTKLDDAKTQQSAAKSARSNGGIYNSNNSGEIASIRSQIANVNERLRPINDQLQKLSDPKVRDLAAQLPELQQQEQVLRNSVSQLTSTADMQRRGMRPTGSVTITVLDGK